MKILQSLPSLLQFYSNDLSGDLLANTLEICATLQASKTLAVSSTAAATLQQLVVSTFERVYNEDSTWRIASKNGLTPGLILVTKELPKDAKSFTTVKVDGHPVEVAQFAYDALQVRSHYLMIGP